jgi:hypothetical protein
MNSLVSFFKKIRIRQILTVFIAGVALFLTTACNTPTNELGARPNNLPVQMGGNNNPHSRGGDGYTDYQMSTDPSIKNKSTNSRNDRASLVNFDQLIAGIDTNAGNLIYPGANSGNAANPDIGHVNPKIFDQQTNEFPSERQPVIDRSDPDVKILEKVGEAFKDASSFLKEPTENAVNHATGQWRETVEHSGAK